MTRDDVIQLVGRALLRDFGGFVVVREVNRVRRVAGDLWIARVVVPAASGDVPVAELRVSDDGAVQPLSIDEVVESLKTPVVIEEAAASDRGADAIQQYFGDLTDEEAPGSELSLDEVRAQTRVLLKRGDLESLKRARDVLPRLLADPDERAETLLLLGRIELRLGQRNVALSYLEAAARELADRFDMEQLEACAQAAQAIVGKEAFAQTRIAQILETCRKRLKPLATVLEARAFATLTEDERQWFPDTAVLRTLVTGEYLVREGDPSRAIFIIKSGLISVVLETHDGTDRVIRVCYPGWLLGESSVLVRDNPRCTASLRAEDVTEVWSFDAAVVLSLMRENAAFAGRIAVTKHLHRIDSFFSMHPTVGQLEVQVRDDILACLHSIQTFDDDEEVITEGQVPPYAILVARGRLDVYEGKVAGKPSQTQVEDTFFAVRDAMHQIPSARSGVARRGAMIAFFDSQRLHDLAARSPEQVTVILERLG